MEERKGESNPSRAAEATKSGVSKSRRQVLRHLGVVSALLPAAYSYKVPAMQDSIVTSWDAATGKGSTSRHVFLVRDFADSRLELMRLLKEAAEIEHSLMLQYLYAAFSVKPKYQGLAGTIAATSDHLLGIAIQEMQHLGVVNRLLVAIGGSPCLMRQDFPYEPDIYPCTMNLEPLTRSSLAKYVYAEAPVDAIDRSKLKDPEELQFVQLLKRELGPGHRGNHVGSVYRVMLERLEEFAAQDPQRVPDLDSWKDRLQQIMHEGEIDHYAFFMSAFLGTHPALSRQRNVWELPLEAADYPSYRLPADPSAYIGHPNQYEDPRVQALAWLSNLHYWAALSFLDLHYRQGEEELKGLALEGMMSALFPLGMHLPKLGAGIPFDQLSAGSAPCPSPKENLDFARSLVTEAEKVADGVRDHLPSDYRFGVERDMVARIDRLRERWAKA